MKTIVLILTIYSVIGYLFAIAVHVADRKNAREYPNAIIVVSFLAWPLGIFHFVKSFFPSKGRS